VVHRKSRYLAAETQKVGASQLTLFTTCDMALQCALFIRQQLPVD
jgi:hypothetical protein